MKTRILTYLAIRLLSRVLPQDFRFDKSLRHEHDSHFGVDYNWYMWKREGKTVGDLLDLPEAEI